MFGKKAFRGRIFGIAIGTIMLVSLLTGIAGAAYPTPTDVTIQGSTWHWEPVKIVEGGGVGYNDWYPGYAYDANGALLMDTPFNSESYIEKEFDIPQGVSNLSARIWGIKGGCGNPVTAAIFLIDSTNTFHQLASFTPVQLDDGTGYIDPLKFDISVYANQKAKIRIDQTSNGQHCTYGYYKDIQIETPLVLSNSGGGSWQYYKNLTISNPGNALSDYQVLVNLTGNSFPTEANQSGADIRFADENNAELNYWTEIWDYANRSAKIWVNVTSIPAGTSTMRMWYGNPSATSSSNGDTTFLLFDDFDGTSLNTSKWWTFAGGDGAITVSGGVVRNKAINGWADVSSNTTNYPLSGNISVERKFQLNTLPNNLYRQRFRIGLVSLGFDNGIFDNENIFWKTYAGTYVPVATWNRMIQKVVGTTYYWNIEGVYSNSDFGTFIAPLEIKTMVGDWSGPTYSGDIKTDWIFVRKYASPEPSVSMGAEPLNNGLLAEWHFDGDAKDSSGNGNDGTIYGATFMDGIEGKALKFDGVNDYVATKKTLDNAIKEGSPVTLTAWINLAGYANPSSSTPGRLIVGETGVSFQTRYGMYIDSNGKLKYGWANFQVVKDAYISGNSIIPLNEWHFVSAVHSGNNVKLFIDGNLDTDFNNAAPINPIDFAKQQPVSVGMWLDWWEQQNTAFNGTIDDVRVYNRALNADEIKQLYSEVNQKPSPVISLSFNQASFTADDTKYSNISVTGSGYTVKTYVNVTMPDGTQKYAYYQNANFQPTDPLLFSDTKVPLYDGTWDMHDEVNWTWNIYAMTGTEQVGTWTWNFWYEDVNNLGIVLATSTASYSVIKKEIKGKISFIYDVAVGSLPLRKAKVVLIDASEKPVATPVETDEQGSFIIPITTGKPINDLSLKVSLDNSILSVNNPSGNLDYPPNYWFKFIGGNPYSWKLPLNQGKYEYDFVMSDVNKAKKLYNYLLQLDSWTNQQTQNTLESKKLTVYYPLETQGFYSNYKVFFNVYGEYGEYLFGHEYGHFIKDRSNNKNVMTTAELLTRCNRPEDHSPNLQKKNCDPDYSEVFAFSEGWAEFMSVAKLEPSTPPLDPILPNGQIKYNFETAKYLICIPEKLSTCWAEFDKGENVEGRNAAVLWDLFDNGVETINKWEWSWKPPFITKKVSILDNYDGNYQIKDMVDILKSNKFNTQKELQLLRDGYWFNWDKIPTDDTNNKRLKYHLIEDYNIDWVETANAEKIDGGNTIRIYTEKNSLWLRLNNEKTKVNLEIDDGRTDEFIVKTEDGKLNVYRKSLDPKDYRPLTMVEFFDAWVANNKPYPDRFTNILANQGWDTGKLTAYSPVTIHLYDSSGKHTGINETSGDIERNVLASYYSRHKVHPEELDWIGEDNYSLIIRGTDYGTAYLELNLTHIGITTRTFYEKVPITPVSKASISDNRGTSSFLLSLDNNGDGIIDEVITPSLISVEGVELYNVTFIPPLNSTNVYAFSSGILPIRFSARNITTNEFVIDQSVNVSIINTKDEIIAYFTNDSGSPRVIWDPTEEQYSVKLETQNYPLIHGQTYAVSVTFGNETDRKGDALAYFRLTDSTPPTTNLTLSGALGNNGWYTSDVQVSLTTTDNESGSGVNITDYSFDNTTWNTYTVPFNITSEGTTTLYYHSTDNAGNIESTKNQTIKIDKTPPQITINTPANASSYILNQNMLANWSVIDSLSGIASVTATIANGKAIDTAKVGTKTFNVNATDNAGNNANKAVTYSIVYNYSGLLPPFKANGNNDFNLGGTIPVKFQLWDANKNYISTATARIYSAKVTNGVIDKEINGTSSGNANTGNLFRYENSNNQYIFNLATKPLSVGTWRIRISLDDGTSKYATIGFKP